MKHCESCERAFEPRSAGRPQKYCSRECRRRHQNGVARRALAAAAKKRAPRRPSFEPVVKRCAVRGCRALFLPAAGAERPDAVLCFSHRRSEGTKSEPVAPGTIHLDANLSFA